MYRVLNTPPEYTYFYVSKNITSYTFVVFKIVESLQCIPNSSQRQGFCEKLETTCIFFMKFSHGHLGLY